MSKTFANPVFFAATAILFTVASFTNASGAAASSSLLINSDRVAPVEMRSGSTLPPDPWEPNVAVAGK
ncbi:MAG TPA: hypothetical protein VMZ52_15605 [Bryobacteraceae bacterium]|nr:hypothetical protein [Bryobacteraceae bacterium]